LYFNWLAGVWQALCRVLHEADGLQWGASLVRRVLTVTITLALAMGSALAASPGCAYINTGALDYAGSPVLLGLNAATDIFYAGDQISLTYTTTVPKAGVTVEILMTSAVLGLVITNGSSSMVSVSGTVANTGLQLLQTGYVDAVPALPFGRSIAVAVTCSPAPAPSSTVISSSVRPTVFGQSTTFTANVTSIGGTPTGNVVFAFDGVQQAPVALVAGTATLATSSLAVGTRTVSATYTGNASFGTSSATLSGGQVVNSAATSTVVSTAPRPSTFGQSVTLTANVAATAPATGTPAGNVIFTIDGVDQSPVALSSGAASMNTTTLGVGGHTIAARYVASGGYAASSGSQSGGHTVGLAPTATALTQSANPTSHGQSASFTATVSSTGGLPTGSVVFTVDGVAQAPVPLSSGVAVYATSALSVGNHSVRADYFGNSNFAASNDALASGHDVAQAATSTVLSGPGPIVYGQGATFTANVTSAYGTPTGTVTFSVDGVAQTPVALVAGSASFNATGLTGGNRVITAAYSGATNFAASTGTLSGGQVVNSVATTTTVGASPTPSSFGQSVTFTATVASTAGTPDGSVIFTINGSAQAAQSLVGGQAQLVLPSPVIGSYSVSAAYAGTASFTASNGSLSGGHVVGQAATVTTLASSANPSVSGQGVTFTAHVASSGGTPGGTVTFAIDGVAQPAATLSGGNATLLVPALGVGSHVITATYSGATNFLTSGGTLAGGQVVGKATTTTAVSSSGTPSAFGGLVTLTATVAPVAPGVGTPTGTVTFSLGGVAQVPSAIVAGVATFTTSTLSVGNHGVSALYNGDGQFSASNGTLSGGQSVQAASTSSVLVVSPEPSAYGQATTLTATVTSSGGVPAGTVTFSIGGVDQAPVVLHAGVASLQVSNLTAGSHAIQARYDVTTSFAASTSNTVNHQVNAAASTTTISSSANPAGFGDNVTFTANVTSPGGTAVGSVSFKVDGVQVANPALVGGSASFSTTALAAGNRVIVADYQPSGNFVSSSATLAGGQTVIAQPAIVVATTPNPVEFGQSSQATATLTSPAGTPSGSVVFSINGVAQPGAGLSSGVASLDLSALVPGHYTITASYGGDSKFAGAIGSRSGGHDVSRAITTAAIVSSAPSASFGDSISLTATITANAGAGTPAGSVIFSIDGVAQAASPLVGGQAVLTLPSLGAGSHTVSVAYAGDSRFAPSSGSLTPDQLVAAAGSTLVVSASPIIAAYGQAVTLGADVTALVGTPSGSVVFTVDGVAYPARTLSAGHASLTLSSLLVGAHSVSASYAAQGNHGASSDTLAGGVTVVAAATSLVVAGPVAPLAVGATGSFTATVTAANGTPTGSVIFTVDGVAQAPVALVNGVATLNAVGFATAGNHSVSAAYLGSVDFAASSNVLAGGQSVGKAATTTVVTSSAASMAYGGSVTLTATVDTVTPMASDPAGTVDFYVDGVLYGSALLANGVATASFSGADIGLHPIRADYIGSPDFSASSGSVSGGVTVNAAMTTATLVQTTANIPAVVEGQPVSFEVSVVTAGGPAAGMVDFSVDGTPVASVALVNGVAVYTAPFGAGSYVIGADFLGTSQFAADAANTINLTVDPPPVLVTLVENVPEGVLNQPYFGSVTPVGGSGPHSVVITLGSLPPNLQIDPVTGAITGTPVTPGTYTFTVQATDQGSNVVSAPYTITIVVPVVLDLASVPNGVFGVAYSQQITAAGGTGSYGFTTDPLSLPGGLSLAANGLLSGTPNQLGNFAFTVTATDTSLPTPHTGTRSYSMSIAAPTVSVGGALPDGSVGVAYAGQVTATGGSGSYTYSLGAAPLPPGLVLDSSTGDIAGTPSQAGTFNIRVVATDGNGFSGFADYVLDMDIVPVVTLPASLPDARQGRAYMQSLAASGAQSPYGYSISAGALPDGLALDAVSGMVSGVATTPGNYGFTVLVTDANGLTGSRSYSVSTLASTAISMTAPVQATGGVVYAHMLNATGGTPATTYSYTLTGGALPAGLLLDSATGEIAGTTTALGGHSFTIEAKDDTNGDSSTLTFLLTVVAPTINVSAPVGSPVFDAAFSDAVVASGGSNTFAYALTSGALPAGLTLNSDGTLTGTPIEAGPFSATVTATDANSFTGSVSFGFTVAPPSIVVSGVPTAGVIGDVVSASVTASGRAQPYTVAIVGTAPPALTLAANGALAGTLTTVGTFGFDVEVSYADGYVARVTQSLSVDSNIGTATMPATVPDGQAWQVYSASVAASGSAGPFSYALDSGSLPAGLTLNANGTMTGTPEDAGNFTFAVEVTDTGTGKINVQSYSLYIADPVLVAATTLPNGLAGTAYGSQSVAVTGGATPYVYGALTGTLPNGLTYDGATATISGTPIEAGSFTFSVPVTDDDGYTGSNSYTISIAAPAVTLTSLAPANGRVTQLYAHAFTAGSGTAPYAFTLTAGALPPGLTLSLAGALAGTPTTPGTYNFEVTAKDANNFTGNAHYSLVVTSNDGAAVLPPAAGIADGVYGVLYSESLAATGGTPTLTYAVTSGTEPPGLSVDPATGILGGTPSQVGDFSFVVTVTDGAGYTNSQAYDVHIDPPSISFTGTVTNTADVGGAYSSTVSATGAVAYAVDTPPPGLSIDASGVLSGIPTVAGSYSFTIVATDADGFSASQAYSITVSAVTLTPPASLPDGQQAVAYSQSLVPSNGTGPFSFAVPPGDLPPGLSLHPTSGLLSGTPTLAGSYSFVVSVTDAYGNTGSGSYGIDIDPVAVPPADTTSMVLTPSSTAPQVGEPVTFTAVVTATGGGTATGIVTFTDDDGTVLGVVSLDGSGVAQLVVSFGDAQSHIVTASLAGNAAFGASSDTAPSVDAVAADTSLTLSNPGGTGVHGAAVVVVATVSRDAPSSGAPASGGIIFSLDGVAYPVQPTLTGTATLAEALPPGVHTLSAVFAPDDPALDALSSDAITVTVEAETTVTLTSSGSAEVGDPVAFTAVVDTNPVHSGDPTGDVQFEIDGVAFGAPVPLALGVASLNTSALAVGSHAVKAVYVGDGVYRASSSAILAQLVTPPVPTLPEATVASLSFSDTSPSIGEVVTMTLAVMANSGQVPTGLVTFQDTTQGIVLGTVALDGTGSAQITYAFTDSASHSIVADYAGDIGFDPSSDSATLSATASTTDTALAVSSAQSFVGVPVTLTATVTRQPPASGFPEPAIVEFVADGVIIGHVSTNGGSVVTLTTGPLFQDTVFEARYVAAMGSVDSSSASAAVPHDVVAAPVDLDVDLVPDTVNGGYIVNVDVTPQNASVFQPSGTVTLHHQGGAFTDQTVTLTGGQASIVLPANAIQPGMQVIEVTYSGDTYFAGRQTSLIQQVLGDTTTNLTMSDATPSPNRPITFHARVLANAGSVTPTGSVTFSFLSATWSNSVTVPLAAGIATTTITFPDASPGVMSVSYSGDGTFGSTAGNPLRRSIAFASLYGTSTVITSSAPTVGVGQSVVLSANVTSSSGLPTGNVVFYDGTTALGTVNLTGGSASLTVPGLSSGTHLVSAYYAGNSDHAASRSADLAQRVIGVDAVMFSVSTRPSAFVAAGQSIAVVYTVQAVGGVDVTGISIAGNGIAVNCPASVVPAGSSMECVGIYVVTDADMASGSVSFTATLTAAGIGSITSGTVLTSGMTEVSEAFEERTEAFLSTRQKLLISSLDIPDIFDRLLLRPGRRPGTVLARSDGDTQVLAFNSSLADVLSWGAAQAAENLGTQVALDPLPLNVWIDARLTLHADTGADEAHWGNFGTLAMGADYLLTDRLLLGTLVQGDWMTDDTDGSSAEGSGFLAGAYASLALGEHLAVDGSLLYGRSWNSIEADMFGQHFSGEFETERLVGSLALAGFWDMGDMTIKPDLRFFLATEDGEDYVVHNEDGDAVAVAVDSQVEFKLSFGSDFEYRVDLGGMGVLTPKTGFDFGYSTSQSGGAAAEPAIFGSVMLGLDFEPAADWRVDSKLTLDFDSSGWRALSLRGGFSGNF